MGKNKYRLTKIRRNDKLITKKIENNMVIYECLKDNEIVNYDEEDLKSDYIKNTQISGRLEGYLKKDTSEEKTTRVNKVIANMKKTKNNHYVNSYYSDIPLSINYHNDNKNNVTDRKNNELISENKHKAIYNRKAELVSSNQYKDEIQKIYNALITKELLTQEVYSKNQLIEQIKDNRNKYLERTVTNKGEELTFDDHFNYHLTKKVYKRLTQNIREKLEFKVKQEKTVAKTVKSIIKELSELNESNITEYLYNQFLMNTIDINKTSNKNISSSIDLEKMRQEDIFYKKIAQSITLFQQKLITETGLKLSESSEQSIDSLGTNNLRMVYKGDSKEVNIFLKEIIEKFSKPSKEVVDKIYDTLAEMWNLDKNTNEEEITICLQNIVELRSRVIHKKNKDEKNKDKIINIDSLLENDNIGYLNALKEKYESNNVNKYFKQANISKIIEQSISNNFIFTSSNYMPRFSKILNRSKYISQKQSKYGFDTLEFNDMLEDQNIAVKFLLKEIYYNEFRDYLECNTVNVKLMAKIKENYIKNVYADKKFDNPLGSFNQSHSEEYKYISKEITKGNYNEIITIWEIYILAMFKNYLIENKYSFLFAEQIKGEYIYTFESKGEEEEYTNESKVLYLLSKGLNRRELNELMNSLKSYWQFLDSKKVENSLLMSNAELRNTYNLLNQSLELLNRKVYPLAKNTTVEINEEDKKILNTLLSNKKDIVFYTQGADKLIEYKFLRFIKDDKIHLIYQNLFKTTIKSDYINDYPKMIDNLCNSQKAVSNELSELKRSLKGNNNYAKHYPNEKLLREYNENLVSNFKINTVRLFTFYKLSNFVNEIYSLYVRTIKAIERDFALVINYQGDTQHLRDEKEQIKRYINHITVVNCYGLVDNNFDMVDNYFDIRDEVAHYNYFNDKKCRKSLKDYYEMIYQILSYNFKRKKAFRKSLNYIFEKHNIEITYSKDKIVYSSQRHQYAKKDGAKGTSWGKLYLICDEERELYKKVFEEDNKPKNNLFW